MKIGIIKEGKVPQDKRVPFTPVQCKFLLETYSDLQIAVQPCSYRCYTDEEYKMQGVALQDDLTDCDILMGVKEVPVQNLIPGKKYLFFSHTIKMQAYNKKLLQALLKNKIQLIDYECLVDENFNRVIGFGRYAGIVGAYNGIMGYGLKYGMFELKPAHLCHDKKELFHELEKINLPNIKIIVTGGGRVANGALETMGALEIRKVTPYEFLNYTFREPVYVQLHSKDFHALKNGAGWSSAEFYKHPELFNSTFSNPESFADNCDLLIHCTYWNPKAPLLFSKEQMKGPKFKVSVIADVTCDINGSIPSTTHPSTIDNKFYGYNPHTEKEDEAFAPSTITVMAVDNLPCELPRDASDGFGKDLMEKVIPALVGDDNGLIERGSITLDGKLTDRFAYLAPYVAD